jgi:hypothetical protein
MSGNLNPDPEEIRRLDEAWRMCRRRIDALLTDSALIDLAHISLLKQAYLHIPGREYQGHYQAIHAHHEAVFASADELKQSHLYRDHSSEETRQAYPGNATHFRDQLSHMKSCVAMVYETIHPQVPALEKELMEGYHRNFLTEVEELMALLDEAAGYARQLQADSPTPPDEQGRIQKHPTGKTRLV